MALRGAGAHRRFLFFIYIFCFCTGYACPPPPFPPPFFVALGSARLDGALAARLANVKPLDGVAFPVA